VLVVIITSIGFVLSLMWSRRDLRKRVGNDNVRSLGPLSTLGPEVHAAWRQQVPQTHWATVVTAIKRDRRLGVAYLCAATLICALLVLSSVCKPR
jgi:hypothetical protein